MQTNYSAQESKPLPRLFSWNQGQLIEDEQLVDSHSPLRIRNSCHGKDRGIRATALRTSPGTQRYKASIV
jgi:hypothetical protein